MKRINNKGVVLLETLMVSVFILVISVFVYRNVVPLMGQYEKLENFDDIDSVYAANLIKNLVISNVSLDYIDNTLLNDDTIKYLDISNCDLINPDGTPFYSDSNYCKKIKKNLNIGDNDIMYLTRYNAYDLNQFRDAINDPSKDYLFSGGEFGKFREYLKTVANNETFYAKKDELNDASKKYYLSGMYRVFISRNVKMIDGSTIKKYANIGIYEKKVTESNK